MNKEINDLISYYQEEKQRLEELLEECLKFADYEYAAKFQKALGIVNNKLGVYHYLNDPRYPKKKALRERINHYNKIRELSPAISDYLDEEIQKTVIALEELENQIPGTFHDRQEFDETLHDLVQNKIRSFVLILKENQNLYLKFSCKKDHLIISITPDAQIGKEIYFPKSSKRLLKSIGFGRSKSKKCLKLKLPLSTFKDGYKAKIITCRVIYEVFFINGLDSNTTLIIQS